MDALDFTALDQLVQLLEGAGVRASVDPEDVNPPGAWVTVEAVNTLTVDGQLQLECAVYLVTTDSGATAAYAALADLYNLVATVLSPDGPVTPQGLVLPGTSTPLPALRVPVNLI